MEKVLTINGKQRKIKGNAMAVFLYNEQFNSDFISDTLKALGGSEQLTALIGQEDLSTEDILKLVDDFSAITIYQLMWTLEKNADRDGTLPFTDWLDQVDFGVMDLIYETDFIEVLTANISRKN